MINHFFLILCLKELIKSTNTSNLSLLEYYFSNLNYFDTYSNFLPLIGSYDFKVIVE